MLLYTVNLTQYSNAPSQWYLTSLIYLYRDIAGRPSFVSGTVIQIVSVGMTTAALCIGTVLNVFRSCSMCVVSIYMCIHPDGSGPHSFSGRTVGPEARKKTAAHSPGTQRVVLPPPDDDVSGRYYYRGRGCDSAPGGRVNGSAEDGKIGFVVARYHTHARARANPTIDDTTYSVRIGRHSRRLLCAACPTIELTWRRDGLRRRAMRCVCVHDTIRHAPVNRPKDPSDKLASPSTYI